MPKRIRARKIASVNAEGDVDNETETEEPKGGGMPDEEDLMLAMMMKDSNFAKIYLASELGARKAIKEILMMMSNAKGGGSSLDDVLKAYLIRKWQKEEEMNKMMMPLIMTLLTKIATQQQVQQCVQQKTMMYVMNGLDPVTAMQKANEECQALATASGDMLGLLGMLGNLGSSGNANMNTINAAASTGSSESRESEQDVSEEELESV